MFQIQSKNKIDQSRNLSKLSFTLLIFKFTVSCSYLIKTTSPKLEQCLHKHLLEMSHNLYLFDLLSAGTEPRLQLLAALCCGGVSAEEVHTGARTGCSGHPAPLLCLSAEQLRCSATPVPPRRGHRIAGSLLSQDV